MTTDRKRGYLYILLAAMLYSTTEVALKALPYLGAMWLLIILVAACPDFVLFLPRMLM